MADNTSAQFVFDVRGDMELQAFALVTHGVNGITLAWL
jgi:hypothetical protein